MLGPDAEGEICVKSPGVMRGYYGNPEATARVLGPDGWLRTGDLGFLDAEGYLYITGRIKDVMILGGENVAPADIEDIVDHVPGVRYGAAVGIDSERTGTQRLHVVAEVRDESGSPEAYHGLVREIVQRVHAGRGHRPARVLLVRAGEHPQDVERQDPARAAGRDDPGGPPARAARLHRRPLSRRGRRPMPSAQRGPSPRSRSTARWYSARAASSRGRSGTAVQPSPSTLQAAAQAAVAAASHGSPWR